VTRLMSRRQAIHIPVMELAAHTRFYVLMAGLLNQLMVHHNVLSANEKKRRKNCVRRIGRIGNASSFA